MSATTSAHSHGTHTADELPLITFALFAYNQSRFIREAVEAALSQDYPKLQIVLSDDCSQDDTFLIMREMADAYVGPHQLVLNQMPRNAGINGHVNSVVRLSKGELLVFAAGDDVSAPERTSKMVNLWLKHGRPSAVTCYPAIFTGTSAATVSFERSTVELVTRGDAALRNWVRFCRANIHGACAAYAAELFVRFGPLPQEGWNEDEVLTFRSLLGSGIVNTASRLVKCRSHDQNVFSRTLPPTRDIRYYTLVEERTRRWIAGRPRVLMECVRNAITPTGELRGLGQATITRLLEEQIQFEASRAQFCQQNFWGRIATLVRLSLHSQRWQALSWGLPRLLPLPAFALAWALGAGIKRSFASTRAPPGNA